MTSTDMTEAETYKLVLPIEDPKDLANLKKRIERLRHTNSVLMREMEQRGAGVDFQTGMLLTFFEGLVEIGALREDQWLTIQMIWEERFNKQITTMKGQLEKAIEQARTRARLAVPGRDQHAGQLIIPGAIPG